MTYRALGSITVRIVVGMSLLLYGLSLLADNVSLTYRAVNNLIVRSKLRAGGILIIFNNGSSGSMRALFNRLLFYKNLFTYVTMLTLGLTLLSTGGSNRLIKYYGVRSLFNNLAITLTAGAGVLLNTGLRAGRLLLYNSGIRVGVSRLIFTVIRCFTTIGSFAAIGSLATVGSFATVRLLCLAENFPAEEGISNDQNTADKKGNTKNYSY